MITMSIWIAFPVSKKKESWETKGLFYNCSRFGMAMLIKLLATRTCKLSRSSKTVAFCSVKLILEISKSKNNCDAEKLERRCENENQFSMHHIFSRELGIDLYEVKRRSAIEIEIYPIWPEINNTTRQSITRKKYILTTDKTFASPKIQAKAK